jgi:hypothetical protein
VRGLISWARHNGEQGLERDGRGFSVQNGATAKSAIQYSRSEIFAEGDLPQGQSLNAVVGRPTVPPQFRGRVGKVGHPHHRHAGDRHRQSIPHPKEELLVDESHRSEILVLRCILMQMGTINAMKLLLDKMKASRSNEDFFA